MVNERLTGSKGRFVSLRVKLLIGFTLLFTLVFAVAFYWFYSFASDMALNRITEDVQDTLKGAAQGVDADAFVTLVQEGTPRADGYSDDTLYWQHVEWLATVGEIEPRARVYTYVKGEGEDQVLFVGSSGAVMEPPAGAKFLEAYTSSGPLIHGLVETTYNLEGYQDKWGRWISAYTPIKDEQGEIVGALGIDFLAEYVSQVQQAIRDKVAIAFTITYVTLFLLVLLISNGLTRPIISLTQIAGRIGEGDYNQDLSHLSKNRLPDEINTLAQVFAIMVGKVYQREQKLRQQVEELKIEIDEVKRQQQVEEIVETEFFQDLRARARAMRQRSQRADQRDLNDQDS